MTQRDGMGREVGRVHGLPASDVGTDQLKSRQTGASAQDTGLLPSSIRASKAPPGTNFQLKPETGKRADTRAGGFEEDGLHLSNLQGQHVGERALDLGGPGWQTLSPRLPPW